MAAITEVIAKAYRIPTDSGEADGTFEWDSTTLIVVNVTAANKHGIGYSYASKASAILINEILAQVITGKDIFDIPKCWSLMCRSIRNIGRSGAAACAISAVDNALWDLKAKLLNLPLINLIGKTHDSIQVYGSGGFTNYDSEAVIKQIENWQKFGIAQFKIKIGRDEENDLIRVKTASKALSKNEKLFVDANGAYYAKQAVKMAHKMAEYAIAWFEEPVSSDDVEGMRFVREHTLGKIDIAAGEYAYNSDDFLHLLNGRAVDVLQADVTRCLGITGFLNAASLAEAYHCKLSSHCAPAQHIDVMCHIEKSIHMEYFWDHDQIEKKFFDGVPMVINGCLTPQIEIPGFGFEFKTKDAEKFAI